MQNAFDGLFNRRHNRRKNRELEETSIGTSETEMPRGKKKRKEKDNRISKTHRMTTKGITYDHGNTRVEIKRKEQEKQLKPE